MAIFSVCYLIVNFTVTKSRGEPVYGVISWDSLVGWLMPLAVIIGTLLVFFLMLFVNKFKLRLLGVTDAEGNYNCLKVETDEVGAIEMGDK